MNDGNGNPLPRVSGLTALINAPDDAFYYDPNPLPIRGANQVGTVYCKATIDQDTLNAISTIVADPTVLDFFEGKTAYFEIRQ